MRPLCLLAVSTSLIVTAAPAASAGAVIEINAAPPGSHRIPRSIFGTFLEPIGRSIYGGLWAQLLDNPSFEDNLWSAGEIRGMLQREAALERSSGLGLPLPWEPLDYKQGVRFEPRWGDAANSYRSLLLMGLGGKQCGVRQQVYLPVHRILRYQGSLYAKRVSGPGALEVSLRKRNQPEAVLARATIATSGEGWKRYEFSLAVPAGQLSRLDPADFVISLTDSSRVLLDQVTLFPADAIDGMDPEMIALARELKSPLIRYGGNFTSGYHWRDGVGPMDRRVSMLNQSWGMPEYNHFGTDEFLRFCELIGAEPQIALNLGSGTPEEAAGWVRYVNQHWAGHKGGLLWELGNELWGDWQIGYPALAEVAGRTRAFGEAVRKVDPRARLIATGADPDNFREWNTAQFTSPPGAFDYLSTHFVVGAAVQRKEATPEFVARASFALPVGLERHLREMKKHADSADGWRGRAKFAFTEWLFHAHDDSVPRFANMGGAICAAGFLNTMMRVSDFTPIADMTGLIEFGGIWKQRSQVYGVPAYWAFRMYSTTAGSTLLETSVQSETYDIEEGVNRIPHIPGVPFLDVAATLNETRDRLALFVVNRDTAGDRTARLRLAGFAPAGQARVETLAAANINAANDSDNPVRVMPKQAPLAVPGQEFDYTFPRASVTVLEFTRQ